MKTSKFVLQAAVVFCGTALSLTSCITNGDNPVVNPPVDDYELRVLTFEDADYVGGPNMLGQTNWSSLIDDAQYDGTLLYNNDDEEYYWSDENNTFLAYENIYYPFWSGGQAISNYIEQDLSNGSFLTQLAIPAATGHNGSANFCVNFGYSGFVGPTGLPYIYFMDGVERVVDHMYVIPTTYVLNSIKNGDGFSDPLPADGWFKIIATGLDANGNVTDGTCRQH